MNFDDLKNLDPNNPGLWPAPVQVLVFVSVFVAIIVAGWYFDITNLREQIASLESKEKEQLDMLDVKQRKSANLEALKEQMKEMEQSSKDMVRQLPDETEVAGLLTDISQTGLSAGLEFKLFQPGTESPKEFYTEKPINLSVVGDYHQFGEFVSGIAALPRIVTAHDITIKRDEGGGLTMDAVAKTYRALDEDSEEEAE